MSINSKDIEKLAHLARIGIEKNEKEAMKKDLDQIIQWVGLLQAAPTQDVEPLANTLTLDPISEQRQLREDEVTEEHSPESLTSNAKKTFENFFIVPKVL